MHGAILCIIGKIIT